MDNLEFKEWFALNEAVKVLNEAWYGHYCGPGPKLNKTCSALADGSSLPEPIDQVDYFCKKHDLQYCDCKANWTHGVIGHPGSVCSKESDELLRTKLMNVLPKLKGREKIAANIILHYFRSHGMIQQQNEPRDPPRMGGSLFPQST